MGFDPVKECQLILGQLRQDLRLFVAFAQLFFHIRHNIRDSRITRMLVERLKQIQLRVFLNLHAQIVKLLNWRVARQEV